MEETYPGSRFLAAGVTLWVLRPSLTQVITVPGDTTMIRSENELSSMITVTEDNPVRSTAFFWNGDGDR